MSSPYTPLLGSSFNQDINDDSSDPPKRKSKCSTCPRKLLKHVMVKSVDKYRGGVMINADYNHARVVLDLDFPRDLPLYRYLKKLMKEQE